jgi:hypothetical protein
MPQSLLTGQLKGKPTYRVWCLYSSFVHGSSYMVLQTSLVQAGIHYPTFCHYAEKKIVDFDQEKTIYFSHKVPKKEELHLYSSVL